MGDQTYLEVPATASAIDIELGESEARLFRDRSQSVDSQIYHQGIHWLSPITMLSLFLFGVLMCLGHHVYYNSLVGQVVGDVDDQQRALRSVTLRREYMSFT